MVMLIVSAFGVLPKNFPWMTAMLLCALCSPTQTDSLGDAMQYLQKYQYIGQDAVDPNMKVTPAEIRGGEGPKLSEALREFQRVAGLPQTGMVDGQTLRMMKKPRCGSPDVTGLLDNSRPRRFKRYALLGSKWHKREIKYKIIKYSQKLSRTDMEHFLQKAFQAWMSVTPLKFYKVSHGEADIEITFGRYNHDDPYPFDGRGGTLAHAFTPGEGLAGDVHFDEDEMWMVRDHTKGSDFFTVAVHEIGHALGLSHSYATGAIMRPFYDFVENVDNVLTNDDIAGIQYLYGPGRDKEKPVTMKPTPRPRPVPTIYDNPATTPTPVVTQTPAVRRPLPEFCRRQVHFDAVFSTNSGMTYAFEAYQQQYGEEGGRDSLTQTALTSTPRDLSWQYVYIWERSYLDRPTLKLTSEVFRDLHWGVDTAFSIKQGSREIIYIFKLWFVWTFDAATLRPMRAQVPLQEIFPDLPNRIDAAFRWNNDGYVYAFKGGEYWKLNHVKRDLFKAEPGFPRSSSHWNLPGGSLNAAMSWTMNGRTYFFMGNTYYQYNDRKNKVVHGYPRNVNVWWLGCPDEPNGLNLGPVLDAQEGVSGSVSIATNASRNILVMCVMTLVLSLLSR